MFARIYGGWVGALVGLGTLLVLGAVTFVAVLYLPWLLVPPVLIAAVVFPLITMRRWEDRRERERESDSAPAVRYKV